MSIDSFKKTVWETALITEFRGVSIVDTITTKPSRVEGNKAIFNIVSGGTVKDYVGSIEWDKSTTAPKELTYNKKKYWAVSLDDVDAIQQAGDSLGANCKDKALELKEKIDGEVLAFAKSKVPSKNTIGSISAKIDLKTTRVYDLICDINTKLSKTKTPNAGRFIVMSSEYVQELAKDPRFTNNYTVLENGILQGANVNGTIIIQSEEVPANFILGLHKSAIGFGQQLDKTEAIRLQDSFADGIRGLTNYGMIELRENQLAGAHVEITA